MNNEKEKYIGSVLFYKHVILGTVFLLILLMTGLCVFLYIRSTKISENIKNTYNELDTMQGKLSQVQPMEPNKTENIESEEVKKIIEQTEEWKLILVNGNYPIAKEFQIELVEVTKDYKVDKRILEPLEKMMEAMKTEGLDPVIISGYRTIEDQATLFDNSVIEKMKKERCDYNTAFQEIRQQQVLPGSSEHHTGLSVDIVSKENQNLDEFQGDTKEAKWLAEHCAEYGFIIRYPKDRKYITGVGYEPWHLRYVGVESAVYIMEHELTLEEYLAFK